DAPKVEDETVKVTPGKKSGTKRTVKRVVKRTVFRKKTKAGDSKRPSASVKTEEDDIEEELTPNDENDDTGVSQEDDKDVTVASKPEVDEKDDMEAEEEPVEDKEADMEKAEVDEKENKATNNEEAGKVIVLWKKRKKVETKSDTDKVELENEPLNLEKNHNEELKAEDDRQERLCFSDEEKDKDMDEDELTDEKREEHGELGFEEEHEEIQQLRTVDDPEAVKTALTMTLQLRLMMYMSEIPFRNHL
ncbi:hypothetical protein Tco_1149995, partial [Tanacetum coccineum]